MSKIKNGGSAFPVVGMQQHKVFGQSFMAVSQTGMTLRDYFAAKALPAVYSEYCESACKDGFDADWKVGVALDSYAMADAMLAAREKGEST